MRQVVPPPPAPSPVGISICVSLDERRAWLFQDGYPLYAAATCAGRSTHPTPLGDFHVIEKHRDWVSTIYHVPMPYFMRLNVWAIGIHEGGIATTPASHGCIRLPSDMARKFFEVTPVGTPVKVIQSVYGQQTMVAAEPVEQADY